jgi:hydroxymethylglutaryl-CoA lyase
VRDLGCYEISLGDTIGIGNPGAATEMVRKVKEMIPVEMLPMQY